MDTIGNIGFVDFVDKDLKERCIDMVNKLMEKRL